jgi:hypothetical protein
MTKRGLLLLLIFVSAIAHAEELLQIWQSPDKGVTQYLEPSTIQRHGDSVTMSRIFNYLPPYLRRVNRRTYTSQRVITEFDCKKMQLRQLSAHWHEGELGSGAILNQENQPDMWEAATQDAFTGPLWKIACESQQ